MLAKRREATAAELISALQGLQHVAGDDLRRLVEITQEFISEELERRVTMAKASADGRNLPTDTIRRDLVRHECRCTAAMRWLNG
jgi:hypothetical protein